MAQGAKLAGHVMRAGTGFHDDSAGVERREKLDQLLAAQFLAKHAFTPAVLAV